MADLDLVFGQAVNLPNSPVEIVFGDDDEGGAGSVELSAAGDITGLRAPVLLRTAVRAQAAGQITGLRLVAAVAYDVNVARPVVGVAMQRWQDATRRGSSAQVRYQEAQPVRAAVQQRWQDGRAVRGVTLARYEAATILSAAVRQGWQDARRLGAPGLLQGFQEATAVRRAVLQRWQEAQRRAGDVVQGFEEAVHLRRAVAQTWQDAALRSAAVASGMGIAVARSRAWIARYQDAWVPRAGLSAPTTPPQPDPCYVPAVPVPLVFDEAADAAVPAHLVFFCERHSDPEPGTTIVIPVRRRYIVINNIILRRVDSGVELLAHSFGMSLDYQSWTWTWSASLHHDAAAHLGRDSAGDPAEIEVQINGLPFRLRIERLVEDRRFLPQLRWSVSGKGKAMPLGAPYAPARSFFNTTARTAQQLAADALTVNGVGIGWAVDWQIVDWQVPAGAWSLQGTAIDAINDIAAAAGGYVQPHPTDAVFRVLPRYPAPSWTWSGVVPDFEIPGAAAEVVGIEYVDRPGYNRVFLGGVGAGVFGPFKRAGSAGDVLAPQVTHALITHPDVHRARGIAELSDTGQQEHVSLRMQVLPDAGVIHPGQFVRYVGDRTVVGIVRRTVIDWSRPTLRQLLEIETHAA
ncbi:hypothetical protein [Paracidovorax cattleyae]|uniref:hypothetical protein n=1 Tax=Paracidovorax cattleyae TaxID=80868 RepID=UPI0018AFFE9E|nr:hypothetical protein [Paracidovorax cattleyae]MBF9267008.1 hypothetical protein [Paracidovorax cattleyae]